VINNILIIRSKVVFNGATDYGIIRDVEIKIRDKEKIAKTVHTMLPSILSKFELSVPEGAMFNYLITDTDYGVMVEITYNTVKLYEIELCLINLNAVMKPKIITLN